jgi:hypothetical protein
MDSSDFAESVRSRFTDHTAIVGVLGLGHVGLPLALTFAKKGYVFGRCDGIPFVGLWYFDVYGPRQDPDSPAWPPRRRILLAVRHSRYYHEAIRRTARK